MALRALRIGFYGEGASYDRFLPPVVERTVQNIIAQRGRYAVDLLEPMVIARKPPHGLGKFDPVSWAVGAAAGCDALIVHFDADSPTTGSARKDRLAPWLHYAEVAPEAVCRRIVPVIPVQMSEAWIIADLETLAAQLNPTLDAEEIRRSIQPALPKKAHDAEAIEDPKETLKRIISFSMQHRRRGRRGIDSASIQAQMGRSVRLDILRGLPAYREFVEDMTRTLIHIGVAV